MLFNMRKPCPHCPFRSDHHPFLHPERAREIANALAQGDWFGCHQTTESVEIEETGLEEMKCVADTEHCAGAMILLEKMQQPSTAMQLSERLGAMGLLKENVYDPSRLDMDAPVFATLDAFVAHHGKKRRRP